MINIHLSDMNHAQIGEFKLILQTELQGRLFDSGEVKSKQEAIIIAKNILQEKLPTTVKLENGFMQAVQNTKGEPVGYVWVTFNEGQRAARITFIYIHEKYRRLGYARQVMLVLEKLCKDKYSCIFVTLNVFRSNTYAHHLYLKLGFKEDKDKSTESRCEMIKVLV